MSRSAPLSGTIGGRHQSFPTAAHDHSGKTRLGRSVRGAAGALAVVTALLLLTDGALAQAQTLTNVGILRCTLKPSVRLLAGSRQRMACVFVSNRTDRPERYSGRITRIGLDVGFTAGGVMSWTVLVRTRGLRPGALAGTYFGASADFSLGVGLGAKVLVGGSRRATVLQPLAVVGQVGINLAAGVAGLRLQFLN
jgi:Protein of unknown function (DUF992)